MEARCKRDRLAASGLLANEGVETGINVRTAAVTINPFQTPARLDQDDLSAKICYGTSAAALRANLTTELRRWSTLIDSARRSVCLLFLFFIFFIIFLSGSSRSDVQMHASSARCSASRTESGKICWHMTLSRRNLLTAVRLALRRSRRH